MSLATSTVTFPDSSWAALEAVAAAGAAADALEKVLHRGDAGGGQLSRTVGGVALEQTHEARAELLAGGGAALVLFPRLSDFLGAVLEERVLRGVLLRRVGAALHQHAPCLRVVHGPLARGGLLEDGLLAVLLLV